MKKGCFKVFVGIFLAIVFILGGLYLLALVQGPEEDINALLPKLPDAERATLEAICKAGGFHAGQLRPLGVATDNIVRDPRNVRSVVIRDGHVRLLCLRGTSFSKLPEISALTELESLWLEEGKLEEWPRLSALTKLAEAHFSGQPLPDPPEHVFPASLKKLGLAGTRVTRIDALLGLALNELHLARTPIAQLPAAVPSQGDWLLNLDETALTVPPGYHTRPPTGTTLSGATLPGGTISGMAGHKRVSVEVTGSELNGLVTLALPTNTSLYHSSGTVEITGRVASGRARVWLQEPDGFFDGPWFKAGKIKGFGFARPIGFVTTEIPAANEAKGRGSLIVQGTPPNFSFVIHLEPIGDAPVTGVALSIRTPP